MFGWEDKILRVDLTRGNSYVDKLQSDIARQYIGGRGLGLRLLYDEINPSIDPLDAENKLMLGAGPLTGTSVPTGGRFTIVYKSPLTGGIDNPVYVEYFGARLKFAGYDMLIVEGESSAPVYIYINNDIVEIKPANHLWGKDTMEVEKILLAEMGTNLDS